MTVSKPWLRARLRAFCASEALGLKFVRFGFVGVMSGLVFAAVTAIFTGRLGMDPKLASIVGYVASMPLNFAGNRRFAFRSGNALHTDLLQFVLLHTCNILLTTFAMGVVVDGLKLHYAVGILLSIVIVPCVNFVAMNWWVFRCINGQQQEPTIAKDKA